MDFQLSPEQMMLRQSVGAALDRADPATWGKTLAALGVIGILLPEQSNGLGLGVVEATRAALEAGARLGAFPVSETMAATPSFAKARPDLVESVLAGDIALTAPSSVTTARFGDRLRGSAIIPYLNVASHVALPMDRGQVAIVAADVLSPQARPLLDLAAPNARIAIDLPIQQCAIVVDHALTPRLALLRAAEMAGAARACFETAVQYLKDRSQFGRPIGANQSLKHIAAEDFVRLEGMMAALDYAAAADDLSRSDLAGDEERADAATSLCVLRAYAPNAARTIAENAIQLHGGIGVTWDYRLNGYVRRILRLAGTLGSPDVCRAALADMLFASDVINGPRSGAAAE